MKTYCFAGKLLKAVVGGKRKLRLVQNYLATILVFAGLYTLTYRLDVSFKFDAFDFES